MKKDGYFFIGYRRQNGTGAEVVLDSTTEDLIRDVARRTKSPEVAILSLISDSKMLNPILSHIIEAEDSLNG